MYRGLVASVFLIGVTILALPEMDEASVLPLAFAPLDPHLAGNLTWTPVDPVTRPTGRADHAIAYDSQSDRIVLFGGFTGTTNGETWAYDLEGNAWTNLTPPGSPIARTFASLAYDAESDLVILFGGFQQGERTDDTWGYRIETNRWTDLGPTTRPFARMGSAMTYDSESDRVILFGGYSGDLSAETWAYDANTNRWTRMDPPLSPPPRGLHALAYDAESDRAILFGGSIEIPTQAITLFRDTWAYDFNANTWAPMDPFIVPPARAWHTMAYDSASDRIILFGGLDVAGSSADTWSYNFNRNLWSRVSPLVRPSPRTGSGLAYDVGSDRFVLFGGRTSSGLSAETWILEPAPPDTTPPEIAISFPASGTVLDSSTVLVRGTASDDRGIHRIEISTDGTNWDLGTGTETWSAVVSLAIGQTRVFARATDAAGNTAVTEATITVLPVALFAVPAGIAAIVLLGLWEWKRIRKARARDPLRRFRHRWF